ncbi:S1 family peptidase [Streptomyces sp. TRM72054]|uniref:S1 family peptidase n=1 Tax=Streptomyces sp. TRM72054 TaxID=2870562 RepID=UPI001C8BB142|nr:S1 family peptidase [Streptomyces sp. TRM72054]MBX9395079.1 S1 family peptidase [Streptomyces sp. TRM72054]
MAAADWSVDGPVDPGKLPTAGKSLSRDELLSDPRLRGQAEAQEVADAIDIAVREKKLKGFTGLKVAPEGVTLHWKGSLPAPVRSVINNASLPVEIEPAQFSLAELDAAARDFISSPPASLGAKVTRVGPSPDFTALEVVTEDTVSVRSAAPVTTEDGIPVRYKTEPQAESVSRWNDTEPFWGGNAIDRLVDPIFRNYTYCTTAFPVRRSNGTEGILSAQHCGTNKEWRTPQGDRLVGTSDSGSSSLDAMVLTGASYGAAIYIGDYASTSGAYVGAAANPSVNSYVFASGSWSGASVLRVTHTNQYVTNEDGVAVGPGFWALNEEGDATVGQGDSGGPVAGTHSDPNRVTARGLISMIALGSYQGSCTGLTSDGRLCSTRSFHVNIGSIASGLGVTVKTL